MTPASILTLLLAHTSGMLVSIPAAAPAAVPTARLMGPCRICRGRLWWGTARPAQKHQGSFRTTALSKV